MLTLHCKTRDIGDPVVNGYSRRSIGAVSVVPFLPTFYVEGDGGSDIQTRIVSNRAGVLQGFCVPKSVPPNPNPDANTSAGIQLGNTVIANGTQGLQGGPFIRVNDLVIFAGQEVPAYQMYKLIIRDDGWLEAYDSVRRVYADFPGTLGQPVPIRGNGYGYGQSDRSNGKNKGSIDISRVVACAENVIRFALCPANG